MVVTIALGIVLAVIILELLPVALEFVAGVLTAVFEPIRDAIYAVPKTKTYKNIKKFMQTSKYASYIYIAIILAPVLFFLVPWWCVLLMFGFYALSIILYETWCKMSTRSKWITAICVSVLICATNINALPTIIGIWGVVGMLYWFNRLTTPRNKR